MLTRSYTLLFICLLTLFALESRSTIGAPPLPLEYAPAPVDNPLKGLVPYQGDVREQFPHSMEFNYVRYSELVEGYDEFNWQPLEDLLNDMSERGHQAVFRIYLEYPGKRNVIPKFLIQDGLKVTKWRNEGKELETPDYENPQLRKSLRNFIAALGKKYDGDARVGFITAGLIGIWGEWHNYPREELFASEQVQSEVMDAYGRAFRVTPVLLRYPSKKNAGRRFGYHDDSFAWGTLDTGRQGDEWFYLALLREAGPKAQSQWKTQPIGGEIRPEAWGEVFDAPPKNKSIQNFRRCVEETHTTWLMDSGMFEKKQPPARIKRAEDEVRRMGYEFHVSSVSKGDVRAGKVTVSIEIENKGVAPFYYDWRPEWGILEGGKLVKQFSCSGKLTGLLPGANPRTWSDELNLEDLEKGKYRLAIRIENPLKNGNPVRFANKTQDQDAPGWLSLGDILVP